MNAIRTEQLPQDFQDDIRVVTETLSRYGANRVILYGSLARGDAHAASDVDICVDGLPSEYFFRALGECLLYSEHSISVIDLQNSYGLLRDRILQEGLLLYERERV